MITITRGYLKNNYVRIKDDTYINAIMLNIIFFHFTT